MGKNSALKKKGVDIQFNWLFVIIAGAIILGFFFTLIRQTFVSNEDNMNINSQQELKLLIRESGISLATEKPVALNKKVFFSCTDGISQYRLDNVRQAERYDYNVIFSPTQLEGDSVLFKTLPFEEPFSIMPFIYLTNNQIEFVFVDDDPLIRELYSSMPSNSTRKFNPPMPIADDNYDRVIFVTIGNPDAYWTSSMAVKNNRVFAVKIDSLGGLVDGVGNVSFYTYDDENAHDFVLSGKSPYIGTPLLLGAIISHDEAIYDCQVKKATQRLTMLYNLTYQRLDKIQQGADGACKTDYYLPIAQGLRQAIDFARVPNPTYRDLYGVYLNSNTISAVNKKLTDESSCTPVY